MMRPEAEPLGWRRALIGFVIGPAVPALAFSLSTWIVGEAIFFFAYAQAIVLGVPTFILLRRRVEPTLVVCMIAGALIAALPWLVMLYPTALTDVDPRDPSRPVHFVWSGVGNFAGLIAMVGALGALGGTAFWLSARLVPNAWAKKKAPPR